MLRSGPYRSEVFADREVIQREVGAAEGLEQQVSIEWPLRVAAAA